MIPAHKAEQLYGKMLAVKKYDRAAKESSLIAVEEIIKSYTDNLQENTIDFISGNPIDYWQQVKKEIAKL